MECASPLYRETHTLWYVKLLNSIHSTVECNKLRCVYEVCNDAGKHVKL